MKNLQKFTFTITLVLLFSVSLFAQNHNLQGLVGTKGSSADYELQKNGYVHINSRKSNNDIYANWWNAREKKCVSTHLRDGRIKSVKKVPEFDCKKNSNDTNWNSQSNNNNNGWNSQSNNNNNNNGWNNQSDNHTTVNVTDLMKVSAPLAYDQLKERGFRFVKGGGKYKVWYNTNTNQCIKTVSIQKHIHDIIKSTQCK